MDRPSQYLESHKYGQKISQTLGSLDESELELFHVNCTNVGYYYCVEGPINSDANLEKLVESGHASKIYLFVEGKLLLDTVPIGDYPKLGKTLTAFLNLTYRPRMSASSI